MPSDQEVTVEGVKYRLDKAADSFAVDMEDYVHDVTSSIKGATLEEIEDDKEWDYLLVIATSPPKKFLIHFNFQVKVEDYAQEDHGDPEESGSQEARGEVQQ